MNQTFRATVLVLVVLIGGSGLIRIHRLGATEIVLSSRSTYQSDSGRYVLHIAPDDQGVSTPRVCRLFRNGKEAWQKVLPFRLLYARVVDDGTIAGFGYAGCLNQRSEDAPNECADLVFTIIDPEGHIRAKEAYRRGLFEDVVRNRCPLPEGQAVVVDPENDQVIFVMKYNPYQRDRSTSFAWRQFKLSTGRPLSISWPQEEMEDAECVHGFLGARPLPGTPLLIAEWYRVEQKGPFSLDNLPILGAHFALLDKRCSPVWQKALPDDYEVPQDKTVDKRLLNWIAMNSAILSVKAPGHFDLYFAKERKRVSFIAKQQENGKWKVVEIRRREFVPSSLGQKKGDCPGPASLDVRRERR